MIHMCLIKTAEMKFSRISVQGKQENPSSLLKCSYGQEYKKCSPCTLPYPFKRNTLLTALVRIFQEKKVIPKWEADGIKMPASKYDELKERGIWSEIIHSELPTS